MSSDVVEELVIRKDAPSREEVIVRNRLDLDSLIQGGYSDLKPEPKYAQDIQPGKIFFGTYKNHRDMVQGLSQVLRSEKMNFPEELINEVYGVASVFGFLEKLYVLDQKETLQEAFDYVVEFTDELLCKNDFNTCDKIFSSVKVDSISSSMVVALLRSTYAAKGELKYRSNFLKKTENKLVQAKGREATEKFIAQVS